MAAPTQNVAHPCWVVWVEPGADELAAGERVLVGDRGGTVLADYADRITVEHNPPGGAVPAAITACRR